MVIIAVGFYFVLIRFRKDKEVLQESDEKIQLTNEKFETILDSFPGLVFYKDKKGNYIWVNKYVADAHHIPKKELEGKSTF